MDNAAAAKHFSVGSTVVLTEDCISLTESFDLRGVICEVVDVRKGNDDYAYRVAPVSAVGVDWSRVTGAFADDLRAARS